MPVASKVPWVVLNPFSSASVPKMSWPPFFGGGGTDAVGVAVGGGRARARTGTRTARVQDAPGGADGGNADTGDGSAGQKRAAVDSIRHAHPFWSGHPFESGTRRKDLVTPNRL